MCVCCKWPSASPPAPPCIGNRRPASRGFNSTQQLVQSAARAPQTVSTHPCVSRHLARRAEPPAATELCDSVQLSCPRRSSRPRHVPSAGAAWPCKGQMQTRRANAKGKRERQTQTLTAHLHLENCWHACSGDAHLHHHHQRVYRSRAMRWSAARLAFCGACEQTKKSIAMPWARVAGLGFRV